MGSVPTVSCACTSMQVKPVTSINREKNAQGFRPASSDTSLPAPGVRTPCSSLWRPPSLRGTGSDAMGTRWHAPWLLEAMNSGRGCGRPGDPKTELVVRFTGGVPVAVGRPPAAHGPGARGGAPGRGADWRGAGSRL